MAVLPDATRAAIWRGLMRYLSRQGESIGAMTKADLRAVFNAADDWVEANAAAYNSALPLPGRTALTAGQKALVLAIVALARYDPNFLRQLIDTD